MPGANYMGGRRNAAKARVKDTTGRLEKSFFGQRRLCAASQATGGNNVPLKDGLGSASISLGHAKRKISPSNSLITSSFIPSPIDVTPSTPRSSRRTEMRPEAYSSSSNAGRSKVLDALDVSEPMFLRQVLNRILTMPDLAGISRNRTKPTVSEVRRPQASDESSPLQCIKRKRSASDLYEDSGSLSDGYNMELTDIEIHDDGLSDFSDDVQRDVRSGTSSSRDYRSYSYSSSPKRPGSNYTPYSNLNSREVTDWKESYPTSIVFRGLKNSFMTTATYPVEEPTVYGTLFEQADPWDTIGQILGLPNTKPSRSPGEVIDKLDDIGQILPNTKPSRSPGEVIDELNEIDQSETLFGTSSAVVDTEERLMSAEMSETGEIEDEQNEYESALATPELEELDGLFIGPSLFEYEDEL